MLSQCFFAFLSFCFLRNGISLLTNGGGLEKSLLRERWQLGNPTLMQYLLQ